MKKILLKLLLATFPILTVLIIYLATDPFKLLYTYSSYGNTDRNYICLNRDYVATELFLQNNKTQNYDSYIFGNSRARSFHALEWDKYIKGGKVFHFDAYKESLYGIERKLAFLDKRGALIKNALIVIDYELLQMATNSKGHIYRKHPALSGENYFYFQLGVFKEFLDIDFISAYCSFLSTKNITQDMIDKGYFENVVVETNDIANEVEFPVMEHQIKSNPDSFYRSLGKQFYQRDNATHFTPHVLEADQIKLLKNISNILSKNNTEYKVIISPLYDQKKTNEADLQTLQSIFGPQRVFDFSGVNAITNDAHNYYESRHYRPFAATKMLEEIYK